MQCRTSHLWPIQVEHCICEDNMAIGSQSHDYNHTSPMFHKYGTKIEDIQRWSAISRV